MTQEKYILYDSINDLRLIEIIKTIKSLRDVNDVIDTVLAVITELKSATDKFGRFNSAHEAYAVMAEEVDELWDHVKVNQKNRNIKEMDKEAVQVAAMAIRFSVDVCDEVNGRK